MQKLDIPTKINVAENQQVETSLQKELNLLEHFEQIIALSENLGLNNEFFKQAKWHIETVKDVLKLNDMQTVIFAHFLDNSDSNKIDLQTIAKSIGSRRIKVLQYMNEIDELEKRRMIRCHRGDKNVTYRVPNEVVEAVRHNKEYRPASRKNLSIETLFNVLNQLFNELSNHELTIELFVNEIKILFDDNPQLSFTQKVKQYNFNDEDLVFLLRICTFFVDDEDMVFQISSIERFLRETGVLDPLLLMGHRLFTENLIENINDNGFKDHESFRLTDKAKTELLGEINRKQKRALAQKDLTLYSSLAVKQLFYNEKEQRQVSELTALLQEENFCKVKQRLIGKGMRIGFACLFHGAPGTGKTETVYQIARQTERNIYQVDISETKSMWFGDSEKRIKRIFEQYRELVKFEKNMPILLFNEADAVIGKRKDVTSSNVAQTENAIQNIILQEMETLEGIMIATTNLTQNLDKAFERRFLYKIEFSKPSIDVKRSIWQSIIPELSEADAATLANRYDFSGGQIENIARKATIDSIIVGCEPDLTKLDFHCQNESLTNGRRAIGFRAAA
jgi:ATP-dependent 26S proteasome regulatory subunit